MAGVYQKQTQVNIAIIIYRALIQYKDVILPV